jgi:hypothetical protein
MKLIIDIRCSVDERPVQIRHIIQQSLHVNILEIPIKTRCLTSLSNTREIVRTIDKIMCRWYARQIDLTEQNNTFKPIVGEQVSTRALRDFLQMFDMDLIDFDVEKNKKNITSFQKTKWRRNSRWRPKKVFSLVSTNMHIFQNAFLF